jgi:monoamine oxidase
MGAEFILPGYDAFHGLVERFGLTLWSKGMRYGVREPRDGPHVDERRMHSALATVGRALAARSSDAEPLSARALLEQIDIDAAAREVILARVEVSAANTADRVDASALSGLAAHADDESPSVAGGNQRVALALAGALGAAVRLGRPVVRIAWGDAAVRVRAGDAEVEGDAAIVAVPASVLDRVRFDPPLPAGPRRALDATVYGHAAKLFVPLLAPTPPSAVLSVPARYWTWTATGAGGEVQPVVSAFAGSAGALHGLEVDGGPATWLESLGRLRPDLALDADGAVLSRWDNDPWARAAYSTPMPGRSDDALTRPVGALHFCGEHTAPEFAALMEGALRSGLRAAANVLRRRDGAQTAQG